jgi:hypothetical protein
MGKNYHSRRTNLPFQCFCSVVRALLATIWLSLMGPSCHPGICNWGCSHWTIHWNSYIASLQWRLPALTWCQLSQPVVEPGNLIAQVFKDGQTGVWWEEINVEISRKRQKNVKTEYRLVVAWGCRWVRSTLGMMGVFTHWIWVMIAELYNFTKTRQTIFLEFYSMQFKLQ